MRKRLLPKLLLLYIGIPLAFLASCVNDKDLISPSPIPDQSFVEEFDTVSAALNRGWVVMNNSEPKGTNIWQQAGGIPPWFPPYSSSGSNVGFIGADYTSTSAGAGTISNWLISPEITMQNGDTLIFYTRAYLLDDGAGDSTDYANRLQVRANYKTGSLNVGTGTGTGDFSTALLDINPAYDAFSILTPVASAFPANWTRFEAIIYGLAGPVKGRFGFRYFVEGGGFNGLGTGVGIDKVTYKSVAH